MGRMKSLGYAYAEYLQEVINSEDSDEWEGQIEVDQYFEDIIHGEVEIPKWFVEQWLEANPIFASEEFSAEEDYEVIMVNVNHSMERDGETFVFGDVMFGLPNNGRSRISSYGQGPDKPSARQSLIERAVDYLMEEEDFNAEGDSCQNCESPSTQTTSIVNKWGDSSEYKFCGDGCEGQYMRENKMSYDAEDDIKLFYEGIYDNEGGFGDGEELKSYSVVSKKDYRDYYEDTKLNPCECDEQGCLSCFLNEYPHEPQFKEGSIVSYGSLWFEDSVWDAETFEADPEYDGLGANDLHITSKEMDKIYKDNRKEREYAYQNPKDGSKVPLSSRTDWEFDGILEDYASGPILITEVMYEDKSKKNAFYFLRFHFDASNHTSPFMINPNDTNDYNWIYDNFNFDPVNPRGYASFIISGGPEEKRIKSHISSHGFKEMLAETKYPKCVKPYCTKPVIVEFGNGYCSQKCQSRDKPDWAAMAETFEGESDEETARRMEKNLGIPYDDALRMCKSVSKSLEAWPCKAHRTQYCDKCTTYHGAESFEADTASNFYRNCNRNGWSVLGRTMHYGCSVFGKVVGGGAVVANNLNFYDKGNRVLRTAGTNDDFTPALELAKVSRELQPDSIEDWSRVAQVTNDRLSQNFSAETKSWRIQNRDSSGKFTKGFVEEIDIADFMELEPEAIPEISIEATYTTEQTVDFVNSMINDDDLPMRLMDSSFVNTLQSHISSADVEMLQSLNDAANMAAFEALMSGSADNQQAASRAVFVTDMLMNYKWGQDYWASEWE